MICPVPAQPNWAFYHLSILLFQLDRMNPREGKGKMSKASLSGVHLALMTERLEKHPMLHC